MLDKRKDLMEELISYPVVEDDRNSAVSFSSFFFQWDRRAHHFSLLIFHTQLAVQHAISSSLFAILYCCSYYDIFCTVVWGFSVLFTNDMECFALFLFMLFSIDDIMGYKLNYTKMTTSSLAIAFSFADSGNSKNKILQLLW